MITIYDKRCSGKTTRLIKLSHQKQIPIVTGLPAGDCYIRQKADEMGLNIPRPIWIGKLKQSGYSGEVLIDDADIVLNHFIENNIVAVTMSDE